VYLWTQACNNMTEMTTHTRFCTKCSKEHPICDFPAGVFRFECRQQIWRRNKQSRKKVFAADPSKRVLWHVWHRAYADARFVYKRNGIPLKQADIAALFLAAGLAPSLEHRVVPKNACRPLDLENAALVTITERKVLVELTRKDAQFVPS
jgi:hypothetical protein